MTAWAHVTFISAGAGSGKTYRLTQVLEQALRGGQARPAGIIGTTFTVKAAAELRERVRDRLVGDGQLALAERSAEALVGTVHSVCERLLRRFAFELGLSPRLSVMSIDDGARFFSQALDQELALDEVQRMNAYSYRLGFVDRGTPEWQDMVKAVADAARENDFGAEDLRGMAESNTSDLLRFFGEPLAQDPTPELLRCVRARKAAMPDDDRTQTTRRYVALLADSEAKLQRDDCAWQVWMRLAAEEPAKRSAAVAAPVRVAAAAYQRHPRFQGDLRGFLLSVYEIAARSLARFEQLKTDHGLVDFPDLEHKVLGALDLDVVRARLASELDLLLVDEFQDTSPMQLALFLKLAGLAKRAVFVGDVKQAVYEFRGCDPSLVLDTVAALAAGNAATETLRHSWRAQPPLLDYLNALFAAAFEGELAPEQVALAAKRRPLPGAAVSAWRYGGSGSAAAIASGVAQLVAANEVVADPRTRAERPVRYGDIALLARTNRHVEALAAALRARNIPMKMTLLGLLDTAEVALAKSCLRRVADQADTLASAEIMALADSKEPEQWLRDRLDCLDGEPAGGGESDEPSRGADIGWGEDGHPLLARLARLRQEGALRSPVEVVARVLNEADIRRTVAAWGPDEARAAQRQKNLDAFLDLAVEYERHAASRHDPGTLTGFLFWLQHPSSPELDLQPVVTTGDAVHVLTYHRAKGLEWPVVVCTDLLHTERMRTWNVRVEPTAPLNLARPLANRVLRYWPNVFGTRRGGVPARDAIETSAEGAACRNRTLAEGRRLAYVGMTRARDRLVLALPPAAPKPEQWLAGFHTDFAIPAGETLTLPDGTEVPTSTRAIAAEEAQRPPRAYAPRWFPERPRREHPPRFLQPSSAWPAAGAAVGEVLAFGQRIAIVGDAMADVGDGLHAVLAAELVNPLPQSPAVARAARLLAAHGVADRLAAADAVAAARRWREFLERRFAPLRLEAEVPLRQELAGGRTLRGSVDLLVETAGGWVLIDHKSSPQRRATWEAEALAHSGQLMAYRNALEAAGRSVAGCHIHFAVTGGLVEVRLPKRNRGKHGDRPGSRL